MKIGILTRNPHSWCSSQLARAIAKVGAEPVTFGFSNLVARISAEPAVSAGRNHDMLKEVAAILVRPMGRGSLDEVIFRLNLLHRLERGHLPIFNAPSAIEKAVDKYYSLFLMEERGIPVPRTIVTESISKATQSFIELGKDVVVKPIYGSQGIGIARVTDEEVAMRIFNTLSHAHSVLYLQEYVDHGNRDIRAFVVGDEVLAAMYRVADGWKTNVHQGSHPIRLVPNPELEELAVSAAKSLGCEIAGVDIMQTTEGYVINEVNSQPGFQGLQSVTEEDIALRIVEFILKRIRK